MAQVPADSFLCVCVCVCARFPQLHLWKYCLIKRKWQEDIVNQAPVTILCHSIALSPLWCHLCCPLLFLKNVFVSWLTCTVQCFFYQLLWWWRGVWQATRESICELCSPVQPWHLSFFYTPYFFFLVELRHVTVWQHDTNALSMLKQEYRNVKVCYKKHNVSVSFFFFIMASAVFDLMSSFNLSLALVYFQFWCFHSSLENLR